MIAKGDILSGFTSQRSVVGLGLTSAMRPSYPRERTVRFLLSDEEMSGQFQYREVFYQQAYQITAQSNRIGYRLASSVDLSHHQESLLSRAAPLGGVQLPPDGQPIVLMKDHQTTGGYPLIGTVIAADIGKVAQLSPGAMLSFEPVTIREAQRLYRQQEQLIHHLSKLLRH